MRQILRMARYFRQYRNLLQYVCSSLHSAPLHFRDLLDHFDDIIERSPSRLSFVEDTYNEIIEMLGETNAPPPNYFLEVYGRAVINSFSVLDTLTQVYL